MATTNKLIRFGRNPRDYNCAANQYLREIVTKRARKYREMSRTGRSYMLKAVLSYLYNEGFLFVKQDKKRQGPWVPVPADEARKKIGHLFRDTVERLERESDPNGRLIGDVDDDDELMPQFDRKRGRAAAAVAKNTRQREVRQWNEADWGREATTIKNTRQHEELGQRGEVADRKREAATAAKDTQHQEPQTFYQSTPKPDIIDLSVDTTPLVENFNRVEQNSGTESQVDFLERLLDLARDEIPAAVSLDPDDVATQQQAQQTMQSECIDQVGGPLPVSGSCSARMERFDRSIYNGGVVTPEPHTSTREIDTHALARNLLEVPIFSDDLLEPLPCWSVPASDYGRLLPQAHQEQQQRSVRSSTSL